MDLCNVYTCGKKYTKKIESDCSGCELCDELAEGDHCESAWCNEHTCEEEYCFGCGFCAPPPPPSPSPPPPEDN